MKKLTIAACNVFTTSCMALAAVVSFTQHRFFLVGLEVGAALVCAVVTVQSLVLAVRERKPRDE